MHKSLFAAFLVLVGVAGFYIGDIIWDRVAELQTPVVHQCAVVTSNGELMMTEQINGTHFLKGMKIEFFGDYTVLYLNEARLAEIAKEAGRPAARRNHNMGKPRRQIPNPISPSFRTEPDVLHPEA